ncbi:MAG: hypothetical protein KIT36_24215, partial [Alphaproteobacteria bacterium]|nr:hypothetical protein [Alphaproteobacteria bacterium]
MSKLAAMATIDRLSQAVRRIALRRFLGCRFLGNFAAAARRDRPRQEGRREIAKADHRRAVVAIPAAVAAPFAALRTVAVAAAILAAPLAVPFLAPCVATLGGRRCRWLQVVDAVAV